MASNTSSTLKPDDFYKANKHILTVQYQNYKYPNGQQSHYNYTGYAIAPKEAAVSLAMKFTNCDFSHPINF